jgi:hypothetical protein
MGVDVLMAIINSGKNMMGGMESDAGTRYDSPGAAYVWNNKQGEWVKPPQPSDDTMNYAWDDDRGWVGTPKPVDKKSTPAGAKTVVSSFANADGSITIVYSDGTTEVRANARCCD